MAYADGFLLKVPTKNLAAYKKMSEDAGKLWMEHGALDYKECAGEDMVAEGMNTTFPAKLGAKKNETVVFSWVVYKDRKHRDAVLKAVMADPRMKMPEKMPFDPKTMLYGGFEVLVDMAPIVAPRAKKQPIKKATAKKKSEKRA